MHQHRRTGRDIAIDVFCPADRNRRARDADLDGCSRATRRVIGFRPRAAIHGLQSLDGLDGRAGAADHRRPHRRGPGAEHESGSAADTRLYRRGPRPQRDERGPVPGRDLALNGTNEVRSQDGKVGDWDTQFILRDASASSCRLDGWPGLAFFGEDTIILCPPPGVAGSSCSTPDHTTPQPISVTRAPGDPREIILAPGGLTLFAVLWTLAANADFCESGMVFSGPYGVHILIPGDPEPLTHLFGSTDRIVPCGQQVQVTAFGAAG
ncbi:hypothetical protein KGQ19_37730 [Catenulispora sp. NL8]|uniref:DUF4232 domain-containing protein n=1 Tax=Catenulispora pinistramenti TaxID=2705254 RepID=A0ABS5L2Q5_9ACTN|nr:hypothetical protein [Catenulispora pinistramenti]MBS2552612.1 hypothetical protein [Catenulispora pinistramenti]